MDDFAGPTTESKRKVLGGIGLSLTSAALAKLIPDVPEYMWIAGLCLGLLFVAYSTLPALYAWLSQRISGCLSVLILAAASIVITVALGFTIYRQRNYQLKYSVCFNHDASPDASGKMVVTAIDVAPFIVNPNRFALDVSVEESSLSFGTHASPGKLNVGKGQLQRETVYAIPDYVEFKPAIQPGPFVGQARYLIRYGRDPSKPLDKTLLIKGHILGAISPDAQIGQFEFVPDFDGDPSFVPNNCQVSKEKYYVGGSKQ